METRDPSLQEICELLIDSRLGYKEASRRASDPRLRELLHRMGESRTALIEAVGAELEALGMARPRRGTFKGGLHRAWMALRDAVSSTNDVNMLAECRRGEAYLIGRYDQHLREGVDRQAFHGLLEQQREQLMGNHAEIRSLDAVLTEA